MSRLPRAAVNVARLPHTAVSLGHSRRRTSIHRKKIRVARISDWDKEPTLSRAPDPSAFGGVASGIILSGGYGKAKPYRRVPRQSRNYQLSNTP